MMSSFLMYDSITLSYSQHIPPPPQQSITNYTNHLFILQELCLHTSPPTHTHVWMQLHVEHVL